MTILSRAAIMRYVVMIEKAVGNYSTCGSGVCPTGSRWRSGQPCRDGNSRSDPVSHREPQGGRPVMATKYLNAFPKPVLRDLILGRWLPVVGAGLSRNANVPSGKKVPLWNDLGEALANELDDFTPNGPLDAISAYQHEFGRAKLIERLTELLLVRDAQPGKAHHEFCSIPFDIVCTTNLDFLLERAYDAIPRYVYPVIDEDQLAISVERPSTLLLKAHGDLRHPGRLVVTEADYDGFLASTHYCLRIFQIS